MRAPAIPSGYPRLDHQLRRHHAGQRCSGADGEVEAAGDDGECHGTGDDADDRVLLQNVAQVCRGAELGQRDHQDEEQRDEDGHDTVAAHHVDRPQPRRFTHPCGGRSHGRSPVWPRRMADAPVIRPTTSSGVVSASRR